MTHIFVSYAHEDKATAACLAEALIAAGLQVWWDEETRFDCPYLRPPHGPRPSGLPRRLRHPGRPRPACRSRSSRGEHTGLRLPAAGRNQCAGLPLRPRSVRPRGTWASEGGQVVATLPVARHVGGGYQGGCGDAGSEKGALVRSVSGERGAEGRGSDKALFRQIPQGLYPGYALNVFGDARQNVGRLVTIAGSFGFFDSGTCDGTPHSWLADVFPQSGKFKGGKTITVTVGFSCGPFECASGFVERTVQLSGGRT